jgi:hypothetical protein
MQARTPVAARNLRPRPQLALAPLYVSQETSHALLGITGRKFLEQVVPRCAGHTVRLGKTVLVPVEIVAARLRELAAPDGAEPEPADDDDERAPAAPETGDEVLAALGLERR